MAGYRTAVGFATRERWVTVGVALATFGVAMFLAFSGVIGSEFLPHLDEGAIWVRGTLAPSTGPTEGCAGHGAARDKSFARFPKSLSRHSIGTPGRWDRYDRLFQHGIFRGSVAKGKMAAGLQSGQGPVDRGHGSRAGGKIPGRIWSFSQPISDNLEEAVSGVKGELAVKIYGDDLKTLEAKGDEIVEVLRTVPGVEDLGLFRLLGQPNLDFTVDRDQAARYGLNVSDVQDAVQTAVGGNALSQVLGGTRYDLVLRYLPEYRNTREPIENIRLFSPSRRAGFTGAIDKCERNRWRRRRSIARENSATSR